MEKGFVFKPFKTRQEKKGLDPEIKKKILIGLACATGLVLLAALGWFIAFKLQFTTYQDSQFRFSIKYPKNWKVILRPQPSVAVVFLKPKDTVLDTIQENFNVTVQPLPGNIAGLNDFSATIKQQMLGVFGKSVLVSEDKPIHWSWRQGREMIFESKSDHLNMVNAWVLRDTQVYIMTFLGDATKFSKDRLVVDEMIHSLQLQ